MGWLVGWLVGIGVIIEHEAGSVASAKGVGTGSTIKRTQKKRGEKQRISWKALSTVSFFFFFLCEGSLPKTLLGHQSAGLGHVLLQELVQVAQAVRVVLHNADGLVPQAGTHQAGHIGVAQLRQLLCLAAEFLTQMVIGPGSQGGHCHEGSAAMGIRFG